MLTPSTAHLWTRCALSAAFLPRAGHSVEVFVPDPDPESSEARREGQAADWVANGVLRGDAGTAADFEGETAPNGWIVTPDMVRHVQGYIDYCRSRGDIVHVQVPVTIPQLFIRGIADAQITANSSTLEIIELKYGWKIVEAEFNGQLLCEAIALFDPKKHDRVIMTIYQPRPHHPDGKVRHWEMSEGDLMQAYQWLMRKALDALSPDARGTVGPQCLVCDGRGRCTALTNASYEIYDAVSGGMQQAMTAAELGQHARFLDEAYDLIKACKTGVKAEVEGRMKRNEYVPLWMWEERFGDREFIVPLEEVHRETGIDPHKVVPMSPAEMERAGADLTTIDRLTKRRFAGVKLVPATQKAMKRLFKKPKVK